MKDCLKKEYKVITVKKRIKNKLKRTAKVLLWVRWQLCLGQETTVVFIILSWTLQ